MRRRCMMFRSGVQLKKSHKNELGISGHTSMCVTVPNVGWYELPLVVSIADYRTLVKGTIFVSTIDCRSILEQIIREPAIVMARASPVGSTVAQRTFPQGRCLMLDVFHSKWQTS